MRYTDYILRACHAVDDDPTEEDRAAIDRILTESFELAVVKRSPAEGIAHMINRLCAYREETDAYDEDQERLVDEILNGEED